MAPRFGNVQPTLRNRSMFERLFQKYDRLVRQALRRGVNKSDEHGEWPPANSEPGNASTCREGRAPPRLAADVIGITLN